MQILALVILVLLGLITVAFVWWAFGPKIYAAVVAILKALGWRG